MCVRRRANGTPVQGFPSVEQLLHAMDADDVSRAVLLGWYWNQPESCAAQNRFYARCVRAHPDRLSACAAIHPATAPEEAMMAVRIAAEDGFVGLGELSPHSQNSAPDDPVLADILQLAGELGLPVNFHVTDPEGRDYPGRVATPLQDFVNLARANPRTTLILAHWGGQLALVEPAALTLSNVYYDTAASPLLYDAGIWARFLAKVSFERVLFGSDFPLDLFPSSGKGPGFSGLVNQAKAADLGAAGIRAVLHDNAVRLFRL